MRRHVDKESLVIVQQPEEMVVQVTRGLVAAAAVEWPIENVHVPAVLDKRCPHPCMEILKMFNEWSKNT
jgi:hypothetical protein